MFIFIKLPDKNKHILEIDEKNSIYYLKNIIHDKLQINILQQRLIYNGYTLIDHYSISDYNIINNSIIYLLYQMY